MALGEEPVELPEMPYRISTPGISLDGFYPDVRVSQFQPYQGGALFVSASNALVGSATVFGRTYPLSLGPEGLAGFVAFGTRCV